MRRPFHDRESCFTAPVAENPSTSNATTCTEDFPQSDPATKEATWPLRSAGESDLLLTLENVQHWLYCDIGETSAPRNHPRPALRSAAPAGALLRGCPEHAAVPRLPTPSSRRRLFNRGGIWTWNGHHHIPILFFLFVYLSVTKCLAGHLSFIALLPVF